MNQFGRVAACGATPRTIEHSVEQILDVIISRCTVKLRKKKWLLIQSCYSCRQTFQGIGNGTSK